MGFYMTSLNPYPVGDNMLFYRKLVLLLFITTACLSAQGGSVTISGLITDATTGEALIGTNVLLFTDTTDTAPYSGAASNRYGFYAIPKIPKGTYYVVFRNIGYRPLTKEVNVTVLEGTLKLNVELYSEEIKLDEVLVKGEREKTIGTSTIDISYDFLKQLPSLSGEVEVFKAIQLLPGIQVASEISSGLYVRGGSPDQTLTLVDGMIVYNPAHLGNFTSTFNSNAIQDVRLIKGAFPAEYGGRLSSVLDIKLRSGTKERDKGSIGLGAITSNITMEGPLSDNATYMLSGRGMYYDAIQKGFQEDSEAPLYHFYDLNTKFTYTLSETDVFSLSAFYSKDKLYNPSAAEDITYDIAWQNGAVNLSWLQINSQSLFSTTTISYINYEFKSILDDDPARESSSDYFAKSNLQDLFLSRDFELRWDENHTLKMGVESALHWYDLIANDSYDPSLELDSDFNEDQFSVEAGLYFQNESQFGARLKTNVGGRFYYFDNSEYFRFEPRASVSFAMMDDFFVKGAFSIAHQFLHMITRKDKSLPTDFWYPSSENVKPSRSTQYVASLEKYFGDNSYLASIEGYYRDMKNIYEFKQGVSLQVGEPIDEEFTEGEGEAYGVEFFFNKRTGDLTGWIGYTLAWTRRQFDGLNGGRIYYPRYDRRHDLSLVLSYEASERLSLGMTFTYATGQGYTLPTGKYSFGNIGLPGGGETKLNFSARNDFKLPDYHRLDLNATYTVNWFNLDTEVYLNLYNVYNRDNAFSYYVTSEEGKTVIKQITLFPFIPTLGLNINF